MTKHTLSLTTDAGSGTLILDGHDISKTVARDGVTITTLGGRPRADVQLLATALDATMTDTEVTVHATREQEALLRAGGWAKEGDVCVPADLLWTQAEIVRIAAASLSRDGDEGTANTLTKVADRLDAYATPKTEESHD